MDWWTDFWQTPEWIRGDFGKTSVMELIAAFASVVASVLLALWIQRRDFDNRVFESQSAEYVRRATARQEVRRSLLERALDLVVETSEYAIVVRDGPVDLAREGALNAKVDTLAILFRQDSDEHGAQLQFWIQKQFITLRKGEGVSDDHTLNVTRIRWEVQQDLITWFERGIDVSKSPSWDEKSRFSEA